MHFSGHKDPMDRWVGGFAGGVGRLEMMCQGVAIRYVEVIEPKPKSE